MSTEFYQHVQTLRDALRSDPISFDDISDSASDTSDHFSDHGNHSDDSFHTAADISDSDSEHNAYDWEALAKFYIERGYVYTPSSSDIASEHSDYSPNHSDYSPDNSDSQSIDSHASDGPYDYDYLFWREGDPHPTNSDDDLDSAGPPEPSEIIGPDGRLLDSERERRRRLRLCFYCGGEHMRDNCELLKEKQGY